MSVTHSPAEITFKAGHIPPEGKIKQRRKAMREKRFRVNGLKDGSYFLAEVQAQTDHTRGDGVIIPKGTTYYLHLQYPTKKDGIQQLSYLLHCGEKIISITTSAQVGDAKDDNFMLPPYLGNADYTQVWHHKIFRKLGIR